MARPPLSDEEIAESRLATCRAATRLFARDGFEAVTMRAIASETGRSHTTAYRYFRSKEEILATVRTIGFRALNEGLVSADQSEKQPGPRVRSVLRAYIDFALGHKDEYQIMFATARNRKVHFPELDAEIAFNYTCAQNAARLAIKTGLVRGTPEVVAHLFWSALHGLVSLYFAEKAILSRKS